MYKIYQIEYGDTLDIIASKTNTTVDNLKTINGIDEDDIMVGNLIIVPSGDELFESYIVKNGDTIYSISKTYDISFDTLLKLNGLNKDDYLYPGMEITIPRDNTNIYITKYNDTLGDILNNLNIDIATLMKENNKIYVTEDQLIVHKKR